MASGSGGSARQTWQHHYNPMAAAHISTNDHRRQVGPEGPVESHHEHPHLPSQHPMIIQPKSEQQPSSLAHSKSNLLIWFHGPLLTSL